MSNLTDKIKGKAEVVGGTIEKAAGKVLGDENLVVKGTAHVDKGKMVEGVANVKEAVADAVDKVIKKV